MSNCRDSKLVGLPGLCAIIALLTSGCSQTTETKPAAKQQPVEQSFDSASQLSAPSVTAEFAQRMPESGRANGAIVLPHSRAPYLPPPYPRLPVVTYSADKFPDKEPNNVLRTAEHPVSTFSVDVDTASYSFVRRHLNAGRMPPRQAVRVEEMINYFPYAYPRPQNRAQPFVVTTTVTPSPWAIDNQLLHIGIRGYDIARSERPRANVVLLIDTSGSMQPNDRLPLLQQGFRLFVEQLRDDDRLAIVTYAGQARTALDPTGGRDKQKILDVIDSLHASGSTAGGEGLQRAYGLAQRHFDKEAVNRVILATDGDFNVGITDPKELERFIADKRKTGIYLSILGVGEGNLNDALMQRLTQAGNGNAAHIDSLLEARKTLSEELSSTMFPIADDVKIQVEFNPSRVAEYRLIGYETRMLRREDFNNDRVDAGDIGAGHTVTAVYEITPIGAKQRKLDPLRYQRESARSESSSSGTDEIAFVKLRYKLPGEPDSRLIERPVRATEAIAKFESAPAEQRFVTAVAAFGQKLRGENALDGFSYGKIADLANGARGSDPEGYRAEFVRLVRMAETLGAVAQR
jgi:Ca-activated chloride channel homolog